MTATGSRDVLATMVRNAAGPMALVDVEEFVVLELSPALEALAPAPLRGASLTRSFPDAKDLHEILDAAAAGEGALAVMDLDVFGVRERRKALAQDVEWGWSAAPVADADGKVGMILLTASDVAGHVEVGERLEMLEGLVDLSRRVSTAEHEDELYEVLAHDIGRLLDAAACIILRLDVTPSRDPNARIVTPMFPAYGIETSLVREGPLEIEPGSAAWRVIFQGETFATDDFEKDPELADYRAFFSRLDAKNGMGVPMRIRGQTLAILLILNKEDGFTGHDLDVAEVFAAEAVLALENARLFEREHRVAIALQEALLPGPTLSVPGVDLAALYRPAGPAGSVGGDFYDVFRMRDGLFGLLLGDVSGKGPEAAAQTALVRHMARGLALRERFPGPVVAELNRAVFEQGGMESFISMLFGVYEPDTRLLCWANAGHMKPFYWRRGEPAQDVGSPGRALGISEETDVRIERIKLAPGDIMVWYTDGLSEARRPGGPMLGETALLQSLDGIAEHSADEIAETLFKRAIAHCGRLEDDVAVLVIKHEA